MPLKNMGVFMRKNAARNLFGLAFLGAAIAVLGNTVGWWNITNCNGWWTVFLIVPGIAAIIEHGFDFWNVALVVIGVWLLSTAQGWLPAETSGSLIWVVILLFIALQLLFGGKIRKHRSGCAATCFDNIEDQTENSDTTEHTAIFSGEKVSNFSRAFRGGTLTAIFSGITLDLRNAVPVNGAVIEATAIFGGVNILVSENCRVELNGVPIFGGAGCKAKNSENVSLPLLTVRYTSIFGGVEIK